MKPAKTLTLRNVDMDLYLEFHKRCQEEGKKVTNLCGEMLNKAIKEALNKPKDCEAIELGGKL
jgi:hypothetical protein